MLFAADDPGSWLITAIAAGVMVGLGNLIQSFLDRRAKRKEDQATAAALARKTDTVTAVTKQAAAVLEAKLDGVHEQLNGGGLGALAARLDAHEVKDNERHADNLNVQKETRDALKQLTAAVAQIAKPDPKP